MTLKDAILKVKVLDRTELDERLMRSTVKLENDLTVTIPNSLIHFDKKVTIPEYIANWIKAAKEEGYNIRGAIEEAPKGKIEDWLELKNVDIFADAWVNGYELEKKYSVRIKNTNQYLAIIKSENVFLFDNKLRSKATQQELEQAGFGWVFDNPGMEVKEEK